MNTWSAAALYKAAGTWGAYPGESLDNVQSGAAAVCATTAEGHHCQLAAVSLACNGMKVAVASAFGLLGLGIGIVRNSLMFDNPLKTVVRTPFIDVANHIGATKPNTRKLFAAERFVAEGGLSNFFSLMLAG